MRILRTPDHKSYFLFFFNPIRIYQLIKSASVSCVTWCSVPLWWRGHTMKAKSTQKISVNKVFSPQASLNCFIEKHCVLISVSYMQVFSHFRMNRL